MFRLILITIAKLRFLLTYQIKLLGQIIFSYMIWELTSQVGSNLLQLMLVDVINKLLSYHNSYN